MYRVALNVSWTKSSKNRTKRTVSAYRTSLNKCSASIRETVTLRPSKRWHNEDCVLPSGRARGCVPSSHSDSPSLTESADAHESIPPAPSLSPSEPSHAIVQPTSFANGRYQVKQFLGEGGKKIVYLAHDTLFDREVAFALIKTEGLDEAGRGSIQRETQAMGRLGSHQHIVTVFDLGQEQDQPN